MKRVRLALAVAAFICGACNAGTGAHEGVSTIEVTTTPRPADASRSSAPPESLASLTTSPAPSAVPSAPDGCPIISRAQIDGMVAHAVSGLDDATDAAGWSHACAWLKAADGSGEPSLLTIQIGWQGSLYEYSAIPGATPIAGLADEAYALDAGDRIALRSGELVAVVSHSGETPLATETFARRVAARLPD